MKTIPKPPKAKPKVSYLAPYLGDPHAWTPAQMLRQLLDDIERGEVKTEQLLIVWNNAIEDDPGAVDPGVMLAGASPLEALGLLHFAMTYIQDVELHACEDDEDDD